jgi:hypothetical protein
LHELATSFVLGYHGCDRAVGHALIAGDDFRYETNEWDWLGSGVYFWESNPLRGIEYAYELKADPRKTKGSVNEPAVVGAVIDLGLCLDLTSSMGIRALKTSYEYLVMFCRDENRALPTNKGGPDRLMRNLDCAVVNHLHRGRTASNLPPFDTVRGIFQEGDPIYQDAGFREKTHVQICVRNLECIKGVFRVPPRYLKDFVPPP